MPSASPTTSALRLLAALVLSAAGAARAQAPADAGAALPRTSKELIAELDRTPGLEKSDKPFNVASAMGRLYHGEGRFPEAVTFLRQALEKAEPLRTLYLRDLAAARKRPLPEVDAKRCGFGPEGSPEGMLDSQVKAVRERAGKEPPIAAACARLALNAVLDVEQLLAGALLGTGDVDGARRTLERILEIAPDDPEALHAHAALLFETGDGVEPLKKARAQWQRYLELRPGASNAAWTRMLIARADEAIAAGGFAKLDKAARARGHQFQPQQAAQAAPMQPPPLSQEAMEAIRNVQVTPEMEANFAKLISEAEDHLAAGQYQKAFENYRQVMPYQPDNGRLKAGLAWALVRLNRQPMADNVWRVAVGSDPAAVEKLGETLASKGDASGAKALWSRLASSDPAYAQRSGLNSRLER